MHVKQVEGIWLKRNELLETLAESFEKSFIFTEKLLSWIDRLLPITACQVALARYRSAPVAERRTSVAVGYSENHWSKLKGVCNFVYLATFHTPRPAECLHNSQSIRLMKYKTANVQRRNIGLCFWDRFLNDKWSPIA